MLPQFATQLSARYILLSKREWLPPLKSQSKLGLILLKLGSEPKWRQFYIHVNFTLHPLLCLASHYKTAQRGVGQVHILEACQI